MFVVVVFVVIILLLFVYLWPLEFKHWGDHHYSQDTGQFLHKDQGLKLLFNSLIYSNGLAHSECSTNIYLINKSSYFM